MAEEVLNGAPAEVVVSGLSVQVSVPAAKAEEAVAFYKAAFSAEEVSRTSCPKRKADQEQPSLLCAELKIGGASFLVCGVLDEAAAAATEAASSKLVFRVKVDNVEVAVEKASKAGANLGTAGGEEDLCCGGRVARLVDPFGFSWDVVSPPPTPAPAAAAPGVIEVEA